MKKRGKEIDYQAKTVMLAGRRYIICRNHQEAAKDAADRASIVAALERQLAKGDKALVGNTGFRRYLKTISDQHFAIDPDKIEEEKKFDGIFVLRTNTDLNPLEAMLIADLESLTETEIEHDCKRFVVRSAPRPAASLAVRAAGVVLPPTVREAAAG